MPIDMTTQCMLVVGFGPLKGVMWLFVVALVLQKHEIPTRVAKKPVHSELFQTVAAYQPREQRKNFCYRKCRENSSSEYFH